MITPLGLARAVTNVRDRVLEGPLADLRRMPRVAVDTGPEDAVGDDWGLGRAHGLARAGSVSTYRYAVHPTARLRGAPVLLVSPLGACGMAFDLRRGCSLVEHLVGEGRHVYQVDDEDVSGLAGRPSAGPADLQRWVDEILPHVVRTVSEYHDGAPVHVVGWSVGGLTAVLAAAGHPDLPIASVTALATPFALGLVPEVVRARPLAISAGGPVLVTLQTLLDLVPVPRPLRAIGFGDVDELLTAPLTMLCRLDDRDFLAQLEAVDDLRALIGEAAPRVGSLFRSMVDGPALAAGRVPVGRRTVRLASLDRPVLLVAGETDAVVPPRAVRAGTTLLSGTETALTTVPGGHLGVLCGRAARTTTWPRLCAFLDRHDPPTPIEGGAAAGASTDASTGPGTGSRRTAGTRMRRRAAQHALPRPEDVDEASDPPVEEGIHPSDASSSSERPTPRRSTRRPPPKPATRTRRRE